MADTLEKIMERRWLPQPSQDFPQRIIAAAAIRRKPHAWFSEGAAALFQSLALPRPALIMALTVLLGGIAGFYLGPFPATSGEQDFASLYAQTDFDMEAQL